MTVLKPAVPGVPAPFGLKDRAWDFAANSGSIVKQPFLPRTDIREGVGATTTNGLDGAVPNADGHLSDAKLLVTKTE